MASFRIVGGRRIYLTSPRNAENSPLLFDELISSECLVRLLSRKNISIGFFHLSVIYLTLPAKEIQITSNTWGKKSGGNKVINEKNCACIVHVLRRFHKV